MNALSRLSLPVVALALAAGCATTPSPNEPPPGPGAVVHFADLGGIRNWRADGNDAILIEGRRGQWYRATFFSPCPEVRFATTIAFVTDATGSLDKFSSIIARGDRCYFRDLERVAPPDDDEREE